MSKKINLSKESAAQPAIIADEKFTLKDYHGIPYNEKNKDEFNAITNYNNQIKKQALAYIKQVITESKLVEKNPRLQFAMDAAFRIRKAGEKKQTEKKTDIISTLFAKVGDKLTEIDVFSTLKVGREGMGRIITNLINTKNPNDRKWIKFEKPENINENGVYILVGIGEKVPKGWTGMTPKEEVKPKEGVFITEDDIEEDIEDEIEIEDSIEDADLT
jgi:hypothetical protein